MKMNKIIIILTMFMFSVSLAQNTTILFLRDGSIIQGTITHEKPNKIFLKTDMGFVQIKPEDIIGREDLAKKGDLTYMSDQIEFVRRYVENLSGKTISWKDSLQKKIDNLSEIMGMLRGKEGATLNPGGKMTLGDRYGDFYRTGDYRIKDLKLKI